MKVLLTGAFGQDGMLLSELIQSKGLEVMGTYLEGFDEPSKHPFLSVQELCPLDISMHSSVEAVVLEAKPDVVIHLAGETSVATSWVSPSRTMLANVVGTANLLEVIKAHKLESHFINATSVEVFDATSRNVNEKSPMQAVNPYGVSKLATAQLTSAMRADGLIASNAFLSNHESKYRPERFVMGKLARGVAAIADGRAESITLGDIKIKRDWSAAEDICEGILAIAEKSFNGDVILASGVNHELSEIVCLAFESVGIENWHDYVQIDEDLLRTNDTREISYNVSKAKEELDWSTTQSVSTWIKKMVESFRH